ncbi:Uncharacterized protein HZ326_30989 [Fusarium oxysporum f. sp. albedinis]|nr:Uncharacterized protein HZ326_30989 [Fusarium oxysporum f. sp. albedinis]
MFNLLMPATWKYRTLLRLPENFDGLKECFYSEPITICGWSPDLVLSTSSQKTSPLSAASRTRSVDVTAVGYCLIFYSS